MDVKGRAIQGTIAELVRSHVAITSTLAVFESYTGREGAFEPRLPAVLTPGLLEDYQAARRSWIDPKASEPRAWAAMLRQEMAFERAFVAAGGQLMAGSDPTGWGGVAAGFGDQRGLELLVEAGFRPEDAIRIATANGAAFLGEQDRIGTIAAG